MTDTVFGMTPVCSHYLHMERYCMKHIFFMVSCLLLTIAAVWGEPAQSTLNLNVDDSVV